MSPSPRSEMYFMMSLLGAGCSNWNPGGLHLLFGGLPSFENACAGCQLVLGFTTTCTDLRV